MVKEDYAFEGRNGVIHLEKTRFLQGEKARSETESKLKSMEEVNKEIIKSWEQQKMQEVKNNPSQFYSENNGQA